MMSSTVGDPSENLLPQDVEKEKLLRILDAGLKAPSHDHLRDWEFILIKDPEQRRVSCGRRSNGKRYC